MQSDKRENKTSGRISLLSVTVLLFLALAVTGWLIIENRTHHKKVNRLQEDLERTNDDKALSLAILSGDNMVFESRYPEAMDHFTTLLSRSDSTTEDLISGRIKYVERALSRANQGPGNNDTAGIVVQYKDSIAFLENTLDSLRLSLSRQSETSVRNMENLSRQLRRKDQLLNKREELQVLSFSRNQRKVYYLGEVKNSRANGEGVGIWVETGSVYRGEWKDNMRHGTGSFEWADGQRYEGEFREDIRQGYGTYFWPSRERYEGEWKNNRRNGYGILYNHDESVQFEGEWKDDKPLKG